MPLWAAFAWVDDREVSRRENAFWGLLGPSGSVLASVGFLLPFWRLWSLLGAFWGVCGASVKIVLAFGLISCYHSPQEKEKPLCGVSGTTQRRLRKVC